MPVNRGRKSGIKNTISTKTKKVNTPWLKNAIKSIGATGKDVFKDISPNIYDIASESTKTVTGLAQLAKGSGGRTGTISTALKNNRYVKAGQDVIKNTIEDLKSGNFNNEERFEQAFMGADFSDWDMDDLDSGTFFDDWDMGDDGGNAIQINNYSDNTGMALAIDDSFRKNTQAQLKGQKANIDVMVAVSSAHMLQQQEISNQILGHLDNITSGINSLVEFNNSTMSSFIESAMGYMETLGSKVDDWMTGGSNKIDPSSVYRDRNGGFVGSKYKELVKQNALSTFKNSDLGFLNDMLKDNLDLLTSNPLGAITKMAISSITPKMWKNSLESLDEAVAGFMPTVLSRIASMADDKSFGFSASVKRTIGKIFGVKNERINEFDMDGKITNKAVQFDQITRHSITEVIPKYLREQTSYLRAIAGSLGVDTKKALNGSEVFDYRRGKYRSLENVRADVYGDIRDTTISKFNSSKFGSALRGKMIGSNEKDNESFNRMIDDFFVALEKHGKYLDITDLSKGSDLDKIIESIGYSGNMANHLRAALKSTTKDPSVAMNANGAIQQAVHARSNLIKNMTDDPTMYNLYAADLGGEIDKGMSNVVTSVFGDPEKTKVGTIGEILNDVRYLLNRGINVRITGRQPFEGIKTSSSSQQKPRNRVRGKTGSVSKAVTNNTSIYSGKEKSVEEYETEIEKAEQNDFFASIRQKNESQTVISAKEMMKSIAFGSPSLAMSSMFDAFANKLENTLDKFGTDFVDPMKKELFGEKDKSGYLRDGLFSGMQNKFLDTYRSFAREFNGKGYMDSHGNWVAGKKEGEQSVVGNIKGFINDMKSTVGDFIFGEKIMSKDEKGNVIWTVKRDKKSGNWMGKMINSLEDGFTGWKEAIFGKTDEKSQKVTMKEVKEKVSNMLPSTITGGIGGAALGAFSGGSILGTLIGGPFGGAVLGGVGGILSQSDKFKNWLFGEIDEKTKERTGGLISKNIQDIFKKNKTAIIGGATVGAAKNMIFGGGVLGNLVGGPIAGALMGGAMSIISKSDMMKKFLYGDDKEGGWHKGIVNMFNDIFKSKDTGDVKASKLLGMNIIGALGGGLTTALIGQIGLVPAMMTPMGPVGGALAGLALSMKASKKGFHEWMFGTDKEIDGEVVHREGVLGQFQNMLQVEVFGPMKTGMKHFVEESKLFLTHQILAPIEFAIEPFALSLKNTADSIKNKITKTMDFIGTALKEGFVDPIVNLTKETIIKPMRRTFSFLFKGLTGIAKTVISAPFRALSLMTNFNDAQNKRVSRRKVMQENRREYGLFGGMVRNMGIRLHYGDMYNDASFKHVGYENTVNGEVARSERRERYKLARKQDFARLREEHKADRDRDYNRQLIAMATGNQLAQDTEENREIARRMFRERKGFHLKRELNFRGEAADKGKKFRNDADDKDKNEVNGMSDKTAVTKASDPSENTQNRILGHLIAIKEFLQGKDEEEKKEEKEETKNEEKEKNEIKKPDDGVSGTDKLLNILSDASGEDGIDFGKAVSDFRSKFLGGLFNKLDKHAKGGKTKNEFVIVGENGPEVARLPIGTDITPNDKPISVVIAGILKGASAKIKGFTPINRVAGPAGAQLSEAQKDYEALKKEGSYEEQQREKKEKEKEEREKELLENTRENKEENKKHHSLWSSIFSKKGLITGGILALTPFLFRFLSSGLDLNGLANSIVSGIGSHLSSIVQDILDGLRSLGSGKNPVEKTKENAEELGNLIQTGDVSEWIAPDGKIDHMSASKTNALLHIPAHLKKMGIKITDTELFKEAKAVGKFAKKTLGKPTKKIGNKLLDKTGINKARKAVGGKISTVKNVMDSTVSFKKAGVYDTWGDAFNAAKENAGIFKKTVNSNSGKGILATVKKNADNVVKIATEALNTLVSKVASVVSKHGGKQVVKFADNIIKPVISLIKNNSARLMTKIAPLLGAKGAIAATGAGILAVATSELAGITLGTINGVSGPARLFRIDSKSVDGWMRVISAAIGGFKGSTVGSILDLINELVVDILGFDLFHEIASAAYHLLAGNDKFTSFTDAKNQFRSDYEKTVDEELNPQYQQYLADNGLTSEQFSFDQYKEDFNAGKIEASTTSFADYNASRNKTLGDRVASGFAKFTNLTRNTIGKGLKTAGNAIVTGVKGVGEKVVDFGKYGLELAKAVPSTIKQLTDNFNNPDIDFAGYMTADVTSSISDDNPLKSLYKGITGYLKLAVFNTLLISGLGKRIGEKVVSFGKEIGESAGKLVNTIGTNHTNMVNLTKSGDLSGLLSYNTKVEDGVIGWVGVSLGNMEKSFLTPIAAVSTIGHKIKDAIDNSDLMENISIGVDKVKNFISTAHSYTDPDKDLKGFSSAKLIDSTNPISGIINALSRAIMSPYINIVRSIRTIGDGVGDVLDGAKETVGNVKTAATNKFNTAKTWVSNKWNSVKEWGNNLVTSGMNYARGTGARGGFGIPYFSQNDPRWANMQYGDSNMSEAGCGPNAFAMVASGLGAKSNVTPVEMAKYAERKGYRDQTGTNWNFMDQASKDYGLKAQRQFRPNESFVDSQLAQGKPVILSGQGGIGTPYTTQGHYVVATGKDKNGNIMINDPRGRRYSGKYPARSVVNNANMAWAMSRGGRGSDKDMLNNFPFLLQGDGRWGSNLYTARGDSSQTIKSSGCGPTSMAMVLRSYGYNVSPIDTCSYALNNGFRTANDGTSWGFFSSIAKAHGLECMDLGKDTTKVSQALDNGFPVIASMGNGTFTSKGHFIVLVGKDTNGNIVVNDPASENRSKSSWPLSLFAREGKNFWAFSRNGQGSINSIIDAGTLNLPSISTTQSEVKVSEGAPTNIISKIGNFFSQFADKLFTGITTGVWDTNYDFGNNSTGSSYSTGNTSSSTSTGSSYDSGTITDVHVDDSNVQKSMYNFYTQNGFTPAATAGIMGNVYQESKFKPNMIQGDGKGPAAGLFQWENYNTKSKRWAELNNYAQSKGKEWTDTKSQLEFALHEMRNGNWMWKTPSNKSYAHVSSFDEFRQMTNPQDAAVAFSNHFERPGKPHNETRMAKAQEYYDMYKDSNSAAYTFRGARGGFGDGTGEGIVNFGSRYRINDIQKETETYKNLYRRNSTSSINHNYKTGGRGIDDSSLIQLLQTAVGLLEKITNASISSNKKLDILNTLGSKSNLMNVTNINGGTTPVVVPTKREQIVVPQRTKSDDIALSIAQGF